MCGIVGYIGDRDAVGILIEGLGRLEYRGYDSAGTAVIDAGGRLQMRKRQGRLASLEAALAEEPLSGGLGIGHTRWATHGKPSEANAHPHCDCNERLALVHNGIIENYKELRAELQGKGHVFKSETDTEIVAHLIEDERGSGPLIPAVRRALKRARGAYALGIISPDEPDRLIAARLGSPLIVGLGQGENFIASDVPAILNQTRRIVYLDDGQIISIGKDSWEATDLDGNPVEHEVRTIDWDAAAAEKDGYEKFMLKEIHEQPKVLRDTILGRVSPDRGRVLLHDMNLTDDELRALKKMYIVSCGTAYYAGLTGKYLIESLTGLTVEVDLASEFRYRRTRLGAGDVVFAVTQSGETADTLASIRGARESGCKIISICNVVGSSIARESDGVIYTHAGPEIGVASTKAYTAQLAAFVMFSVYYGRLTGDMDEETGRRIIAELEAAPDKIQAVLDRKDIIRRIAAKHHKARSALYLGRGFNYPNALEGALKNKEISYMHAEGCAAGEIKHGPIALIDNGFPVVCICTRSETYEKMVSNMREVEARGGSIIAVATEGDELVAEFAEDVIFVPETMERLSPIINAVALQLLAYYIALERGCDIDKPRNLAKSVTVE